MFRFKIFMLLLPIAFLTNFAHAQKSPLIGKNLLYAEAWGVGGYYSANYERVLIGFKENKVLISSAIGIYDNFGDLAIDRFRLIPFRLFLSAGNKGWYGEFGFNYVLQFSSFSSHTGNLLELNERLLLFQYGLRYQGFKKKGLFFRAYLMPINEYGGYSTDNDSYVYHILKRAANNPPEKKYLFWGGIGLGYHFGR